MSITLSEPIKEKPRERMNESEVTVRTWLKRKPSHYGNDDNGVHKTESDMNLVNRGSDVDSTHYRMICIIIEVK